MDTPRVSWSFATLPGELVTFAAAIADASYQEAVRQAFGAWEQVANIDFVEITDHLASDIRLGWSYIDRAGDTLADAHWRYIGTQIIEAEIRFDLHDTWQPQSGRGSAFNFFATAVHEIGHAIGLAHVESRSSIMYAYQTDVATLSSDDIVHVQDLYGPPATAVEVTVPATSTVTIPVATSDIFRFYDTDTGLHFYTNSAGERDIVLQSAPQFQYEGSVFKVPASAGPDVTDVYRFFDTASSAHFYTASSAERDAIQATMPGMIYEGAAFKAYADAGSDEGYQAVHRFLRTDTGTHFYTASDAERDVVEATLPLFRYEGIAYFAEG